MRERDCIFVRLIQRSGLVETLLDRKDSYHPVYGCDLNVVSRSNLKPCDFAFCKAHKLEWHFPGPVSILVERV